MNPVHDLRHIDLNLLVVLDALLAERHISRAAQRLAMTQPAVSHALNRLRDLFADPLLVRVGNEMRLTARAAALAQPLAGALAQVRNVVAVETFQPHRCRRCFRLGISDYGSAVVLPGLVRRLRQIAPGVDLQLSQHSRLETLRQVAEGELDAALGVFPMLAEGLQADVLFQEYFVVLADRNNLPDTAKLTLEHYLQAPHVHVSVQGMHHSHVDTALAARGLRRRIAVIMPHFTVAAVLLAGTDLLLTVASRAVAGSALPANLIMLEPPLPIPPFDFVSIWRTGVEANTELAWLRGEIRAVGAEG